MRRARIFVRLTLLTLGVFASLASAGSTGSGGAKSTSTSKPASSSAKPSAKTSAKSSAKSAPAPAEEKAAPAPAAAPAAPRYAPFSEFRVLTPGQLLSLRFKLTRLGGTDPANAVAVWGVTGQVTDPAEFIPYRRPGFQYEPAGTMPFIFNIEPDQMQAVVDSVGTLPQVVRGVAESRGILSFAMLTTEGGHTRAFEAIVGQEEARVLMGSLIGALRPNVAAVQTLRRFGCTGDLLPEGTPMDADSLVKITMTSIRADKASPGEFLTSAVITNISGAAIPGPLTLVVLLDANSRLIGTEGVTCHVQPTGAAFLRLAEDAMPPGASLRQSLRFWNQSGNKVEATLRLVAGPGTR
ncbi:MAG: hypothetical protein ACRENS_00235 [Candidatus Eiseniibacteriota bacterium]